jgi:hypothetical protein
VVGQVYYHHNDGVGVVAGPLPFVWNSPIKYYYPTLTQAQFAATVDPSGYIVRTTEYRIQRKGIISNSTSTWATIRSSWAVGIKAIPAMPGAAGMRWTPEQPGWLQPLYPPIKPDLHAICRRNARGHAAVACRTVGR